MDTKNLINKISDTLKSKVENYDTINNSVEKLKTSVTDIKKKIGENVDTNKTILELKNGLSGLKEKVGQNFENIKSIDNIKDNIANFGERINSKFEKNIIFEKINNISNSYKTKENINNDDLRKSNNDCSGDSNNVNSDSTQDNVTSELEKIDSGLLKNNDLSKDPCNNTKNNETSLSCDANHSIIKNKPRSKILIIAASIIALITILAILNNSKNSATKNTVDTYTYELTFHSNHKENQATLEEISKSQQEDMMSKLSTDPDSYFNPSKTDRIVAGVTLLRTLKNHIDTDTVILRTKKNGQYNSDVAYTLYVLLAADKIKARFYFEKSLFPNKYQDIDSKDIEYKTGIIDGKPYNDYELKFKTHTVISNIKYFALYDVENNNLTLWTLDRENEVFRKSSSEEYLDAKKFKP